MSSQHSESTATDHTPEAGATDAFPILTIEADGPARFKRQITDDEAADIIATHDSVKVELSIDISDPDVFESIVPKCYETSAAKADVLASVFECYDRYEGYTPIKIDDWSLVIRGSAVDWRQAAFILEATDSNIGKRANDCILAYYRTDLLNDGAALAQLDLLTEYDLSRSNFGREYLLDELKDGLDES